MEETTNEEQKPDTDTTADVNPPIETVSQAEAVDTVPQPEPSVVALPAEEPKQAHKKWPYILLVIVLLIAGFGIASYYYQKKLNKDMAAKRQASTYVNHITVAFPSAPYGFYPVSSEFVTSILNSYFYEGLTSFDKNMQIVPQLALSWENPSTNVWRFRLRHDVNFQNGQKMTADDVVASYGMAIADPDINTLIPTVVSAKKVDDYTVDITTSTPTPILPNYINSIYILPKSLIASKDWNHPIGTGPYKFVSLTNDGNDYNLTRNDSYYGPAAKVKNVTFTSIADDTARLNALKSGKVDVSNEVTPTAPGTKDDKGNPIQFAISPPIDTDFFLLDGVRNVSPYVTGTKTNPMKDVRVRQAMALALDVQSFIDSGDYNKNDPIGTQIVPPSIFGYDSSIKPLQQNVTEAKALMKQAGYANGFTVTFDTIDNLTNFQALLKKQLAAIGINLTVRLNTTDEMINRLSNPSNADISLVCQSWLAPSGDALEAYEGVLGQGSQYNYFAYNDPTINNLVNQINNTLDLAKRKNYLDQLAVYVNQQKYIIPLMSEVSVYDYRSGLVIAPRADGTSYAYQTSGAVPSNLKDYSYVETIEKIFHLKS